MCIYILFESNNPGERIRTIFYTNLCHMKTILYKYVNISGTLRSTKTLHELK